MIKRVILMTGICFGFVLCGRAQNELMTNRADSVATDTTAIIGTPPVQNIESYAKKYDPRKALLYAAILPGSGQIYNKKYWKLPLVYGGFAALVYATNFYQQLYVKYKAELFITINDPNAIPPSGFGNAQLRTIVDEFRRQRDYFLIISGFVYLLQMVDAHVDAHLKEFDLNPQLKVSLRPQSEQNSMIGRSTGIALVFKF